ncbi:DUF455 family protein [Nocardia beijingensis]
MKVESVLPAETAGIVNARQRLSRARDTMIEMTACLAEAILREPELDLKCLLADLLYRDALAVSDISARLYLLGCPDAPVISDLGEWDPTEVPIDPVAVIQTAVDALTRITDVSWQSWDEPSRRILQRTLADVRTQLVTAAAVSRDSSFSVTKRRDGSYPARAGHIAAVPGRRVQSVQARRAEDDRVRNASPAGPRDYAASFFHRSLISVELPALEICADNIVRFRDMPWDFVIDMARQCWDESRHAQMLATRIVELGGHVGMTRGDMNMWEMSLDQPLPMRLAINQRIGEWIGVDTLLFKTHDFKSALDERSAEMLEFMVFDEVTHVAFGNKWLLHLCGDEASVRELHEAADLLRLERGDLASHQLDLPVNVLMCEAAEFTDADILTFGKSRKLDGPTPK